MSEYQYIHFMAVDRPLNDKQLEFMEHQSTRAEISRSEFTNEYHFGDFHGDAMGMMRRGYDVHLHFSNFGIRKLMFRLPELPCDKKTFAAFEIEYQMTWTKDNRGKAGVLAIEPEADAGTFDYLDDVHSMLSRLAPLREMLLQGDLRPLYLAWLVCGFEDMLEPPVPAGLAKLDDSLVALAELYEIPDDLIAASAQQSEPATEQPGVKSAATNWVNRLSKAELKQIVSNLTNDNSATVRADILAQIRQSIPKTDASLTAPSRTHEQLYEIVNAMEAKQKKREAAAEQKARKKLLKSIAADPAKTILRIDSLIAERSKNSYHQAADCLNDLAEALGDEDGPGRARSIAQAHRKRKGRQNMLVSVLRERRWID